MTTRTLHLDGADGRRYVFRSVDKSPVEFEDFEGSVLEDIIQDQVSSFHPTGAPIVSHLLEAVGVLHTNPTFMVVPDDPRLEEYREEFAGLLVLVEERPDDGAEGGRGFAGSLDIEPTDDLFDALEEDAMSRVDAEDLLRARLVDLLVGDRDRSHNNHLWALFEDDTGTIWRVIPRDRDQAFVRFDGFLKRLAREYERRLVTFEDAYPDIFAVTRNAWDIDRRLLVGLDRRQWADIVQQVQDALTDEVISEAVEAMPPEHVEIAGGWLTEALLARRDRLDEAAHELYRVVFSVADVSGTDAAEVVRVTREEDRVRVVIALRDETVTYRRTFRQDETTEIRLHLRGGDDVITLEGGGANDILVRIVGGGGLDTFVDESWRAQSNNLLYDGGGRTRFPQAGSARVFRSSPDRALSWFGTTRDLDWGTLSVPEPRAGYDRDRGLVIVPGLRHDRYAFGKQPFGSRFQIRAGWAFGLNEPIFDLRHLGRDVLGGADLRLRFRWSGTEIINFYGFGNAAPASGPTEFHRVAHKQVTGTLAVSWGDGERRFLEIGPTFTYTSTDTATSASFIGAADPYGSGKFSHAGAGVEFSVDARDHSGTPTAGYRVSGGGSLFPTVFDLTEGFGELHGAGSAYVSPPGGNPVLALRVAAMRVWGRYPFHEAAFLGGPGSVRSLREQRYAGDATVQGSAELRLRVGRIIFPIPSDWGLMALADGGRVFLDGESSSTWHRAVGGGLWFALVNRSNVVQITLSRGEGESALNAGVGFVF